MRHGRFGTACGFGDADDIDDIDASEWSRASRRARSSMISPAPAGGSPLAGCGTLALGAGVMYLLDPDLGARRRHRVRDKFLSGVRGALDSAARTAQYARDRSRGAVAEAAARMRPDGADDWTICQRVRAAIGRVVSHPRAIVVDADEGVVRLRGPILAREVDDLLAAVRRVRGVRGVDDRLDVYTDPAGVPALQGWPTRASRRAARDRWPSAARLGAGLGGAALLAGGLRRRGAAGLACGAAGLALLARGLANRPAARRHVGAAGGLAGPGAVDVQKTINVNAPRGLVFDFFTDWAHFPLFMSNVREVRPHAGTRSHWVVAGPLGVNVEWEAELTRVLPPRLVAWRSLPGSTVDNAGVIRFDPNPDGSTRVDIKLSYHPPGGALGHAVAKLFGADPKSEMDADLARAKTLIETGNPPRDAARPLRPVSAADA
jgi:uncharacterized membrane protein